MPDSRDAPQSPCGAHQDRNAQSAGRAPREGGVRPAPMPVQVDARRIVAAGTAAWFVAFLVLLPFWGRLRGADNLSWLWTCLCGAALGLLGLVLIRKHRGERRVG